jgi:hypothetical protein
MYILKLGVVYRSCEDLAISAFVYVDSWQYIYLLALHSQ